MRSLVDISLCIMTGPKDSRLSLYTTSAERGAIPRNRHGHSYRGLASGYAGANCRSHQSAIFHDSYWFFLGSAYDFAYELLMGLFLPPPLSRKSKTSILRGTYSERKDAFFVIAHTVEMRINISVSNS